MNINNNVWPKAVLFDLDGTLVDSVYDLASAVNILLKQYDQEPVTLLQVRSMIGNGLKKLVERAFAARNIQLSGAELDLRAGQMMEIYGRDLTTLTVPMPGAEALLRMCKSNGCKVAVVTNKPEEPSRKIVTHFGWDEFVDTVVGGDTCAKKKPDPMMLHFACDQLGVTVSDTIMVGDSPADIDSANSAAMKSIAVRGGYTNVEPDQLGASTVIDTLEEFDAGLAVIGSL